VVNHIEFTLFRKPVGYLTKVLTLLPTGEIHKDSTQCAMGNGEFRTISIKHIEEFPNILANIKGKSECLAYGVCNTRRDGKIVSQEKASPSDITRTKNMFIGVTH
jgi:hypothetical protein